MSFSEKARRVLDATVGNLGFGLGFGAAYAAEVPVVGMPIKSLNEGITRGYNQAQVRMMANDINSGKKSPEDIVNAMPEEDKRRVEAALGVKPGEVVDPTTGEVRSRFDGGMFSAAGPAS